MYKMHKDSGMMEMLSLQLGRYESHGVCGLSPLEP
jgi:hypothetical protein